MGKASGQEKFGAAAPSGKHPTHVRLGHSFFGEISVVRSWRQARTKAPSIDVEGSSPRRLTAAEASLAAVMPCDAARRPECLGARLPSRTFCARSQLTFWACFPVTCSMAHEWPPGV